ncbi:intraflagellar transport protein 88 homolog isoform X3 [Takifugu flavidus]|uniref:intraflagellar transport protein 88 homolog isoform X3 n=1 Tax=Takifugu flavidus TaxID=433684 RepID=UPI002544BB80|nr:intraflagellar transport protein 88 homolog isoform X3 [Takifugu flavidus]
MKHSGPDVEEDDLYSGYNNYNPTFDYEAIENDEGFQQAVKTTHEKRPPMTAKFPGTAIGARPLVSSFGSRNALASSMGRPMTGAVQAGAARPMTAVSAAGYSSSLTRGPAFDPLGQARGPAPPLEDKNEDTPEEKIKILEKKVNDLVLESCMAQSSGNFQLALEKAKEASRKERTLVRQREQSDKADQINIDLYGSVLLNLANQYENNEMYPEALQNYKLIVKNRLLQNAGRFNVSMANIYVKQQNYMEAIKLYQKALDQIPNTFKELKMKIMENIGLVFVRIGQYPKAIIYFEDIMSQSPNTKTGYNLVLCYYAIGDKERMKKGFQKLISVPLGFDEDKYIPSNDDDSTDMFTEAIQNDKLHQMERNLKQRSEKYIMTAAKLIAPAIETTFAAGFDWSVDVVKSSQYTDLADDLEIIKAVTYLRQKDFNQVTAIETLKTFEKKDTRAKSTAGTNLSFLYFLEEDYEQAERYADVAMSTDRYNPGALNNKGCTVFVKQEYEKAAEFFKEALRNDSSCTEALYNLGLTYKKLNRLEESVDCFLKHHAILRNSAEVMYQLANLYELLEDPQQAIQWLMHVISVSPTDCGVLAKLGQLFDDEGDESQALHHYTESFRHFPCDIGVAAWLGTYYFKKQYFEKAIKYFERATLIQPNEVEWHLRVAGCYRRSGNYHTALETYKETHQRFPEDIECLTFLVRLTNDMGLEEVQEYANKLKKAEKMREVREQRMKAGREGSGRGWREGSAGSAGVSTPVLISPKKAFVTVPHPESKQLDPLLDSGGDRSHSGGSAKGERLSAKMRSLPVSNEPYETSAPKELDAFYVDPLGPQMERPKTGAKKRVEDDDFEDEELGDDLLPE